MLRIIRRRIRGDAVESSIIKADVDLRDVQEDVRGLAARETGKIDHYRPGRRIGRWTIPKEGA